MIPLKGLTANSPIGYMAACGVLRVLDQDLGLPAKLGWTHGHAVLSGLGSKDELAAILAKHMVGRASAPEWNLWGSTRKITTSDYAAAREALHQDHRATQFLCAFATDVAVTADGHCANTRLDLTSGRQGLLKDLRKIAITLENAKVADASIRSTLFGGPYENQSTFNWDPVTVARHAHERIAPTLQKPKGKKAQVWFAAESLALHPLLPNNGRAQTPGCERIDEQTVYFWPIWQGLLASNSVAALRLLPRKHAMSIRGVTDTWASAFGKSGNYGALLPAKRLR